MTRPPRPQFDRGGRGAPEPARPYPGGEGGGARVPRPHSVGMATVRCGGRGGGDAEPRSYIGLGFSGIGSTGTHGFHHGFEEWAAVVPDFLAYMGPGKRVPPPPTPQIHGEIHGSRCYRSPKISNGIYIYIYIYIIIPKGYDLGAH